MLDEVLICDRCRVAPCRRGTAQKLPRLPTHRSDSPLAPVVFQRIARGLVVKVHQRLPSLLKGLLRVMPVLLVTNAFAIDPYPGEGHPAIGASVIANGGDVKA